MAQQDRQQQDRMRMQRERNRREQDKNWGREVPWDRDKGPYQYGDYGWEQGESVLPEFRDPDVHLEPDELERVRRWRMSYYGERGYQSMNQAGPYAGVGPKGYQRSDDRIMEDVCDRLTQHGQIDARDIQVKVENGEVTLTGTVDSRRTKKMAEQTVDQVRGVMDVHNQLRIDQSMHQNESGEPGGGRGRVDRVGESGVYPASGPMPPDNAPAQGMASWGQGERGSAGYEDSGRSELHIPKENPEDKQS